MGFLRGGGSESNRWEADSQLYQSFLPYLAAGLESNPSSITGSCVVALFWHRREQSVAVSEEGMESERNIFLWLDVLNFVTLHV